MWLHSMFAFYGGFYGGVWCRMLGCILWLHSRVDSMVECRMLGCILWLYSRVDSMVNVGLDSMVVF